MFLHKHPAGSVLSRTVLVLSTVWCLLAALPGCDKSDEAALKPSGFIAIVGVGEDDPLWAVLRSSAIRAFDDIDVPTLSLRAVAPKQSSVNGQKQLLRELIQDGMVGLCIQVTDSDALSGTLDSLVGRGIHVVTLMKPVSTARRLVNFGLDDEAIGAAIADVLTAALGEKGTIAVLHADSVDPSSVTRHKSFIRRMGSHPQVRILLQYDGLGDSDGSAKIVRDTMRRYPRLGGWAIMGDWPLKGRSDDDELVPPTCRVVGVDPFPVHWPCFSRGDVYAMIASEYDEIAAQAVSACVSMVLRSPRRPAAFAAPVRPVTKANLKQFKLDWLRWASLPDVRVKSERTGKK
jgi:ABC-type sugar transport system substrate-binding protein